MNALWLIAIILVSAAFGFMLAALCAISGAPRPECNEAHIRVGRDWMTLDEYRAKYGKARDEYIATQKNDIEVVYELPREGVLPYLQQYSRSHQPELVGAQKYHFRDFDVVVDSVKFIVQCRREYDSMEWELRTIRVQGAQVNAESVDIADFLANNANNVYVKIEADALAQCAAYDHDAPVEAALDAMKE